MGSRQNHGGNGQGSCRGRHGKSKDGCRRQGNDGNEARNCRRCRGGNAGGSRRRRRGGNGPGRRRRHGRGNGDPRRRKRQWFRNDGQWKETQTHGRIWKRQAPHVRVRKGTPQKGKQQTRVRTPESQTGHEKKSQRNDGTTTGQQRRTLCSTPNDATKADWPHECRQCPKNGRATRGREPGMEPTNEHAPSSRYATTDDEATTTKIRISYLSRERKAKNHRLVHLLRVLNYKMLVLSKGLFQCTFVHL